MKKIFKNGRIFMVFDKEERIVYDSVKNKANPSNIDLKDLLIMVLKALDVKYDESQI